MLGLEQPKWGDQKDINDDYSSSLKFRQKLELKVRINYLWEILYTLLHCSYRSSFWKNFFQIGAFQNVHFQECFYKKF